MGSQLPSGRSHDHSQGREPGSSGVPQNRARRIRGIEFEKFSFVVKALYGTWTANQGESMDIKIEVESSEPAVSYTDSVSIEIAGVIFDSIRDNAVVDVRERIEIVKIGFNELCVTHALDLSPKSLVPIFSDGKQCPFVLERLSSLRSNV